jgi:hypothetical protein
MLHRVSSSKALNPIQTNPVALKMFATRNDISIKKSPEVGVLGSALKYDQEYVRQMKVPSELGSQLRMQFDPRTVDTHT